MAVNQTQGVVLAIFGASAGGHLSSLDANATANGLASLATDLSASAGLILGVDLSSNATFTSTVLDNLGVTAGDARTTAEAYFTSQLAAGASRGDVTAAAVEFLLGTPEAPFDTIATTFTATVTEAVTWSQGAGASTLAVSQLRAQQDNAGGDGSTFALTTATDDVINGTAGNDTYDASTLNTLQTGDLVIDSSTTDADVLNMSTSSNSQAPRVTNVETVNVTGKYVSAGLALTNASGINDLNLDTELAGGTATVTAANSLNALRITAGDNIDTVNVTSLASGTRDSVTVNLGSADTATVTGSNTGADTYTIISAGGSDLTLATVGADDAVEITANADFDLTSTTTLEDLTINALADIDIDVTTGLGEDVIVSAGGDVNIDLAGSAMTGKGMTKTGSGSVTLSINDPGATGDFKEVVVDTVEIDGAHTGADYSVTVNDAVTVNLDVDTTASKVATYNIDNADGDLTTGALVMNLSESQATKKLTTGAKVDTLVLQATPDEASDTLSGTAVVEITVDVLDLNAATEVVSIIGSDNLTISSLENNGAETVSAVGMTGELTISDIAKGGSIYGGSGNDSITSATATGEVLTIYGGAGNDTIDVDTNVDKAAVIYGQDGDDTIRSTDQGDTIDAGAGDDTIVLKGTNATTVTLGDGADEVRYASGADGHTIKDAVAGVDTIILTGAGAGFDLTDVSDPSSGAYDLDGNGAFNITLTGSTATDLSDLVQLGRNGAEYTAADGATLVAGDKDDHITMATDDNGTFTLGAGADTFKVIAGTASDVSGTSTIKDFNIAEDEIVLFGTSTANVDLSAVQTDETYTFGGQVFEVILTDVEESDVTGFFRLGDSENEFVTKANSTTVGGALVDYIKTGTSTGTESVTGGLGGDIITLSTAGKVETVVIGQKDSQVGGQDQITGFTLVATDGDVLDLPSTNLGTIAGDTQVGDITGVTISSGVITAWAGIDNTIDEDTLDDAINFLVANIGGTDTVAFEYQSDEDVDGTIQADEKATYVFQAGSTDVLVELVGVTGVTAISGTAAANTIAIS